MDWNVFFAAEKDEKPLDRLVEGYSNTAIFRTMAFVGDSLSSGEFETVGKEGQKGYHDLFAYSFGQFIARANGLKAYNFSRGGMTAREYLESFADQQGYWDPALAAQAYVVALGVNDLYFKGAELGSVADIDPEDETKNAHTFLGDFSAIVSRYKKISPDAKFFFLTMPNDEQPGSRGDEINRAHRDALFALSAITPNSYVIDQYTYGPFRDADFRNRFYLHGHRNPSGYLFVARMVDSYIDYIIRHNPEDFRRVGLIGTGIRDGE